MNQLIKSQSDTERRTLCLLKQTSTLWYCRSCYTEWSRKDCNCCKEISRLSFFSHFSFHRDLFYCFWHWPLVPFWTQLTSIPPIELLHSSCDTRLLQPYLAKPHGLGTNYLSNYVPLWCSLNLKTCFFTKSVTSPYHAWIVHLYNVSVVTMCAWLFVYVYVRTSMRISLCSIRSVLFLLVLRLSKHVFIITIII